MRYRLDPRERRRQRVRARIRGTSERPRLSVFRSHRHIYAQLIDDVAERTLAAVSDVALGFGNRRSKRVSGERPSAVRRAGAIGALIATKAKVLKISRVVFDRGPYAYHGAVKALAEGARSSGLKF